MNKTIFLASLTLFLTACGGGSTSSDTTSLNNGAGGTDTNVVTPVTCNKGIPSKTSGLTNVGLYKEPLYFVEASYPLQFDNPLTQNKRFVNVHENTLTNGILYEKLTPIDNQNIDPTLFYEKFWQYNLTNQGIFTHEDFSLTNLGWPVAYVTLSQDSTLSSSDSNDQCNLNLRASDNVYTKVDLSGKPISIILEKAPRLDFQGYKYITNALGYYLDGTEETGNILKSQDFKNSLDVFPQGSYIYIPTQIKYNGLTYFFDDYTKTEYTNLSDWSNIVYKHITVGKWVIENVGGLNVNYHIDANGNLDEDIGIDPAIQYKNIVYDGEWQLPQDVIAKQSESTGEFTRMNKTAVDAVAVALKKYYFN